MKLVSPTVHGGLDYLTVLILVLAPAVLGLEEAAAVLAYGLAVVHLLLTLVTGFSAGLVGLVPLGVHGAVELLVGITLTVGGLLAGTFTGLLNGGEAAFFVTLGVVILAVWVLSDYGAGQPVTGRRP